MSFTTCCLDCLSQVLATLLILMLLFFHFLILFIQNSQNGGFTVSAISVEIVQIFVLDTHDTLE